ncbi:hypothetical protein [Spirochaeta africana]|uniref:Uncharacterized protein n=1 Tax=Spirochaeta africana (strain ATCC 700263 / DSM 8902 / Z-7692) TaxID=889378 RepID=H9UJT1_SPIAZ|nr:hypothetical protein [Spirochaeta africana]AFG37774.1 hypothetical protein Spiaf_1717 [Spirochaeta africana DSM 8902]
MVCARGFRTILLCCLLAAAGNAVSLEIPEDRLPGSAAEHRAAELIARQLAADGIEFEQLDYQAVRSFDQSIPFSYSSIIYVPPAQTSGSYVTLAVPLDQPAAGAYPDLTTGIQMTLDWILTQPERNYAVVFLGGEFSPELQWGSRALAASGRVSGTSPVIYIAIFNAAAVPELVSGSHGRITPRALLEQVSAAFDEYGVEPEFPGLRTASYRLNRNTSLNLVGGLMSQEIPTIGIEFGTPRPARAGEPNIPVAIGTRGYYRDPGSPAAPADSLPANVTAALELAAAQPLAVSVWEELYGIIPWFGGESFIIPETTYLLSILAILTLGFLLAAQKRKVFRRYLHAVTRHFWILLMVFALLFAALIMATWVISIVVEVRGFPGLWEHYLLGFIAAKGAAAFLLSLLLIRLFNHIPHIPHGRFFSAAAVVSSFASLVVLSGITLAYAYSLLVSFVLTIGFSVGRKARTKGFFLLLAPLSLLLPLAGAVQAQDQLLIQAALFNTINGNLLLALLFLPFFLMGIRMHIMLHQRERYRPTILLRFSLLIASFGTASILIILFRVWPFSQENPQKIDIDISVEYPFQPTDADLPAVVQVLSDAPVTSPLIYAFGTRLSPNGVQLLDLPYSRLPEISAEVASRQILQRQELILRLDGDRVRPRLSYRLHSDTPLFFHHSDVPVRLENGRTVGRFEHIPGIDFPIELVQVAGGVQQPFFRIEADFPLPPQHLYTPDPGIYLQGRITYRGETRLRNE